MFYKAGCMQDIYTILKMTADTVEKTVSNNLILSGSLQTEFELNNRT